MYTLENVARIIKTGKNLVDNKVQKVQLQGGQAVLIGTENKITLSAYEKRQAIARYKAVHQKNAVERLFKAICS